VTATLQSGTLPLNHFFPFMFMFMFIFMFMQMWIYKCTIDGVGVHVHIHDKNVEDNVHCCLCDRKAIKTFKEKTWEMENIVLGTRCRHLLTNLRFFEFNNETIGSLLPSNLF
jgi:hypothetical protein